jgi:hypothetical protein
MTGGDAKLTGTAAEVTAPDLKAGALATYESDPGPFHLFYVDLTEVVLTSVAPTNDYLSIRTWRPGGPVHEVRRS